MGEEVGADDTEGDVRDDESPRETLCAETNRFEAFAKRGDLGPAGGDERRSRCGVTPVVVRGDRERRRRRCRSKTARRRRGRVSRVCFC